MKTSQYYNSVQADEREKYGCIPIKNNFIVNYIGSDKKVLDVGCNDGELGEALLKNGNDVYGCDFVKKNLKIAKKRGLKVKFVDLEKNKLPYPPNSFDVLILADVIEHVFDTDFLIQNCYKVLKPGGKLIVTTPNLASLARRIMLLFGISPYVEYSLFLDCNGLPPVGHIRYFTIPTLIKLLTLNKYKILVVKADGLKMPFLPRIKFVGNIFPRICTMIYLVAWK